MQKDKELGLRSTQNPKFSNKRFSGINTLRAISLVVEQRSPKLLARVRFLHRPHNFNLYMKYVYHSSKIQDLKKIEPRVSTHGSSWVYAMEKPEYSLMFLGNHSDLINQTGFDNGIPYIAERFDGALEYAYKNKTGSIYTLDGTDFKSGSTTFSREFVCEHTCEVIKEIKIENALKEILNLEAEGEIKIYRYPILPPWIPEDKSDLIEKVIEWSKFPESTVLETVKQFHPDILQKILQNLKR